MKRRRPRSIRVALVVALVAVLAGIVAATAGALAFIQGDPCADTHPLFVCPEGTVDAPYSIQLKAIPNSGNGPPYSYEVLTGALPPGISMTSDGLISGKPTQAGGWKFWVELSDNPKPTSDWCKTRGTCAQREFAIGINPRLRLGPESAAPGTVGVQYSLAMTASMVYSPTESGPPSSPVTWSISAGALPPGLTLGPDGVISGTPTAEGSYSFTVLGVLDPQRSDTKALTLDVRQPVVISAPEVPASEVGAPLSMEFTATGGTGTYTWTFESTLPAGVNVVSNTISGRPQDAGTFPFTATATDTENRTAEYTGTLKVAPRLTIATLLLKPAKVGRLYRAKLVATGGVLPKIWKATKGRLPRGIRLDRQLGVLSGTPVKPGRYRVWFEVVDALKVKSTKRLRLIVTAA